MTGDKKKTRIQKKDVEILEKDEAKAVVGANLFRFSAGLAAGVGVEAALTLIPDPTIQTVVMSLVGAGFVYGLANSFQDAVNSIAFYVMNKKKLKERDESEGKRL
jgi:phosphate/sulfate permease